MLDKSLYENFIATSWLGHSYYFFDTLASTNTYAKQLKFDNPLHGTLVLAEKQTGGRGQHHKKWEAEPGKNLIFSIIFEPRKKEAFTLLTLACALSVLEVLNQIPGIDSVIKWPNDILIKEKKVCGILTETQFSGNKLERVILGVGLNVNQLKFSENLLNQATSLVLETQKEQCREKLIADILKKLEFRYRQWNEFNPELPKEANKHLVGYGEWISLNVNGTVLDGKHKFLGIDASGRLITLNKKLDVNTFAYEQVRVLL